jgi:peptide deformylase
MNTTDDIILYDTQESLKVKPQKQELTIFKLVSEDDPILKKQLLEFDFSNPPVDPNNFASSLVETCKKYNGYGLSANQCGFEHRVFVMGAGDEYVAYFNPKVIESEGESHIEEGCLSFPLLGLRITRPKKITVEYQDFTGQSHTKTFDGITARCFLHELDHMNGIVYTNRVKPLALAMGLKKRNKFVKKYFRK